MEKITKEALGQQFKSETKTVEVKAWNGEVEIKKLTIAEKQESDAVLMKDVAIDDIKDGKIEVSVNKTQLSAVIAVSHALVSPRYKVQELLDLPSEAMEGIAEIKLALDEWDTPKKSKAKNSSSE